MERKIGILFCILFLVALFSMSVFAMEGDGPSISTQVNNSGEPQYLRPNVFGSQTNILQIPACSFVPRSSTTSWSYSSSGYIYATSNPIGDGIAFWATVTLPSGASIHWLDLYYYDTDASNNITATMRAYTGGDYWGTAPSWEDIVSASSTGSAGYGYSWGEVSPSHTINNDVAYGGGAQYTVVITLPFTPTSALRFKGVDIWWHRQVSPAPGTASFSDVPTSHPFFQYVEALASSGITAGCGGGNYCPDAPLTRGQMAVFLSKALGLHWFY